MGNEIKAALTPDEWAAGKVFFRKPKYMARDQEGGLRDVPKAAGAIKLDDGYGIEISEPKGSGLWVWDDSWALTLAEETRHATAALCLLGQPFGFTWGDVDVLRAVWLHLDTVVWGNDGLALPDDPQSPHRVMADVIDRIAALLPPRQ